MRYGLVMLAPVLCALVGCATGGTPRPSAALPTTTANDGQRRWETAVTATDSARLATLGDSWAQARGAVPARLKALLDHEGPLVDPSAALDLPALPPGPYYCRLVRLGGRAGFATFKPDFCIVDGTVHSLSFTKQSGSILPGGWLFPDTDKRQVFLGTFRPARVKVAPAYSTNPAQDVAGVVERVGAFRWRLVLTRAGGGAVLDIYELVPVTPRVPGAVPAVPGS